LWCPWQDEASLPRPKVFGVAVRARAGGAEATLAFSVGNRFCTALLYGRTGRLTAQNGGVRPGQWNKYKGAAGAAEADLLTFGHQHLGVWGLTLDPDVGWPV
jgi:hypothetical protein